MKIWICFWSAALIISLFVVILNVATFHLSGSTPTAAAFDAGQVVGIVIWLGVGFLAGVKLKKALRK
jgi:hypothetical protein